MNNHWLSSGRKKKLFKSVDDVGMEVWSSDGTFEDFIKGLTREQKNFLFSMQLADFSCEINEETFRIELTFPS
jgi:hypothetical protein